MNIGQNAIIRLDSQPETLTAGTGIRRWSMHCDMSNVKDDGSLLAAFDGFPNLSPLVDVGDPVILRDGDGNSMLATVESIHGAVCHVRPDWSTWESGG